MIYFNYFNVYKISNIVNMLDKEIFNWRFVWKLFVVIIELQLDY